MDMDRKSNRPTAGMKGTLPSKGRSGKAVCGSARRGAAGKAPRSRRAMGLRRGLPRVDEERARASAPPAEPGGGRGDQCTCWSKKYSDSGCARASRSGTASASPSSHGGGPRAGAIGGG
jgi:hypothetical protein